MKLRNVNKNGTMSFTMSDGRIGLSYKSGYVRVSVKMGNPEVNGRFYQINKVRKSPHTTENTYNFIRVERVLIDCVYERLSFLQNFDLKNCQK